MIRKTHLSYLIIGVVWGFVLLAPQNAFAAQLFFKIIPNDTGDGATVVEVRIDPQAKNLNAVEGTIGLRDVGSAGILSVMVETGGSVLTLWPALPQYYPNEKVVRFVGGATEGFDRESLILRMRIFASLPGNANISWIGGSAYLDNGRGTKENVSARSITVSLTKSDISAFGKLSHDNTPPHFDAVEVGRDPSVYDGKYFISFHATDDDSGLARYEVKEDQELTNIFNGVYVLKNQDRKARVTITAYDQAGNSKTIEVPLRFNWVKSVIIILLVILIFFFVFRYGYKKITKK